MVAASGQIVNVRAVLVMIPAPPPPARPPALLMSRSGQQHVVNGRIVGERPAVMVTMWLQQATPPPMQRDPPGAVLLGPLAPVLLPRRRGDRGAAWGVLEQLNVTAACFCRPGLSSRGVRASKRHGSFR